MVQTHGFGNGEQEIGHKYVKVQKEDNLGTSKNTMEICK
jgi:hypothetical protein